MKIYFSRYQLQVGSEAKDSTETDDIVALDDNIKGILPSEISKLVERRREVKKLIKETKNITEAQLIQVEAYTDCSNQFKNFV